ncbi:MAG: ComF family protein [Alphaproteobacteria bacterium]|nr:ComF family protein [Alphaproteobacteria bacterium]
MIGRNLTTTAARAGTQLLNMLLPPRCPVTGEAVAAPGQLSAAAWAAVQFLQAPQCDLCGFPFEYHLGEGALCGPCLRHRPAFDKARAVMRYEGVGRDLILAFKHGDRIETARLFGRWMARLATKDLTDQLADGVPLLIAPVPLHRWRLFRRRYNQAALLAHALGADLNATAAVGARVVVRSDLLIRHRNTPVQGGNAVARRRNIAGAFEVRPRHRERVAGATVLLVDDVHTTGATLAECAGILRRAGAARIHALTLARVVRPDGE